jgi:hypothetical protein
MNASFGPFEQAQQLSNMWIDFVTRMATAGMAGQAFATPPDAGRAARNSVFETLTRSTDEFLRSDQFLQMTKQSLDASITFRKQLNEFLTKAHHDAGGVAQQDVDDPLSFLRRVEKQTTTHLEAIASRIDDIDRRLGALEKCAGKRSRENGESHHQVEGARAES